MQLKKIELTNFMSIKHAIISLDNQGLILVKGDNQDSSEYRSNGAGKCLEGTQRIFDADKGKYVQIREFVKNKSKHTIGINKDNKLCVVSVCGWHNTGLKPVYKISTDFGEELTAAKTHPILTDKGFNIIGDLCLNDWVACSRKLPVGNKTKVLKETWWQLKNKCMSRRSFIKQGGPGLIGESDIVWQKVKSIKYVGESDCYDITVDSPNHVYLAENFFVHNSSVFNGITFALFEKTTRDLSANDYINEAVGKGMCIILDFIGDDQHHYRIARHRKDGEFKNDTLLFQDKKNITAKSNKDTNQLIEKIIHVDFLTFTNSILFGQGIIKTFTMATDSEKKKILDKILKLDVWSKALEEAKSELKDNKEQLADVDYKIENKGNLIDSKQSSVDQIKLKSEDHKKQIEKEIKQLKQNVRDEKSSQKNKVNGLENQLDKYQTRLCDLDKVNYSEELNKLNDSLKDIREKLNDLKKVDKSLDKLKARIISSTSDKHHTTLKINELKAKYKEIKSGVGSSCPVCGQDITEEGISGSLEHIVQEGKKFKEVLKGIQADIDRLEKEKESLEDSLSVFDELESKERNLLSKISEFKEKEKSSTRQKAMLEDEIQWVIDHIEEIRQGKEIMHLEQQVERRQKELDSNSYEDFVKDTKKEIDQLIKSQKELELDKADLIVDKKNLEFAVSAFGNSGIKSYILDSVTPYLNKRANYYISKLTGGTTEIEFTTQTKLANGEYRDKFDVQINNHIGGSSYKKNSTGERKRVDLAISLALQDLVMNRSNSKFNFLLYDECFDGLDDIGCENVIDLLQEMQKKIPSIFVITHNETLKSFFEHTLLVTKKDKETKVKKVE